MKIKLNLISPQKKEEIRRAYWLRLVLRWEVEFVSLVIFFIVVLVSMNLILKTNIETESNGEQATRANDNKYTLIKEYDTEISDITKHITSVKRMQANQLYWSKLMFKLNEKVLTGIEISSLLTSDYGIMINGKVDTRDKLIAFKDSFSQDACFSDVNLPLSNLVSKSNIEFQMSLKIKKECLK
jgi:hypothetical protein